MALIIYHTLVVSYTNVLTLIWSFFFSKLETKFNFFFCLNFLLLSLINLVLVKIPFLAMCPIVPFWFCQSCFLPLFLLLTIFFFFFFVLPSLFCFSVSNQPPYWSASNKLFPWYLRLLVSVGKHIWSICQESPHPSHLLMFLTLNSKILCLRKRVVVVSDCIT